MPGHKRTGQVRARGMGCVGAFDFDHSSPSRSIDFPADCSRSCEPAGHLSVAGEGIPLGRTALFITSGVMKGSDSQVSCLAFIPYKKPLLGTLRYAVRHL